MVRQDDAGWSHPRVLGILSLIFVCGLVIGAAGTSSYLHLRIGPKDGRSDRRLVQVSMERLRTDLALSSEQQSSIAKELDDYAKYYQNIEDERDDVAAHGLQRIYQVLTPGQRRKFDALFRPTAERQ